MSSRTIFKTLAAIALCAGLAGCTTYVTVETDPEGATVTDPSGTVTYGIAPVEVPFDRRELEAAGSLVPGFTARWPSGAVASSPTPLFVSDLRFGMTVKLERPKDAPGLETDLQFALERAQKRARAAEAERDRLELYLSDGWFWGPRFGGGIILY